MLYDVITIGSATRDVFLTSRAMHPHRAADALTHIEACFPFGAKINVDGMHFDTGGGAGNNAVTFARLGKFKVAALCRVGQDSAGQDIVRALEHDHVSTSFVQTTAGDQTAYSTIISPGGEVGERTILVYRGASEKFEHKKIPWSKLKAKWFYVSSLGGDLALLRKLLDHARRIKAQVAFNPGGQELSLISSLSKRSASKGSHNVGLRQAQALLGDITFLILNREESSRLTGVKFEDTKGLLRALARLTPSAIMTDGPKGAYAVIGKWPMANGQWSKRFASSDLRFAAFYVPSVGHQPRNLTGAGDAFGSGFVTGWIKSRGDIKYALRLASFNADSVVQHVGAKVGILEKIPSKQPLQKLPVREIRIDK